MLSSVDVNRNDLRPIIVTLPTYLTTIEKTGPNVRSVFSKYLFFLLANYNLSTIYTHIMHNTNMLCYA